LFAPIAKPVNFQLQPRPHAQTVQKVNMRQIWAAPYASSVHRAQHLIRQELRLAPLFVLRGSTKSEVFASGAALDISLQVSIF
jgi:hypothetical protein